MATCENMFSIYVSDNFPIKFITMQKNIDLEKISYSFYDNLRVKSIQYIVKNLLKIIFNFSK